MPETVTAPGGDAECCNCHSAIGPKSKVQITNVTPADGQGDPERWCPRCFVWKRMRLEPERWNASQAAVIKCQFEAAGCGWISVSFGARPGSGLRCFHCGRGGGILIEPKPEDIVGLNEFLREAQETAGIRPKARKATSGPSS